MQRDRGVGLISTAAGIIVFLLFLLLAVQLLFGLYAASTVTAVANDAAQRAAAHGAAPLEEIEQDARGMLGQVGESATFEWAEHDGDGDGDSDTVVLEVVATPPRFVPSSVGGLVGLDEVRRVVRVRREAFDP